MTPSVVAHPDVRGRVNVDPCRTVGAKRIHRENPRTRDVAALDGVPDVFAMGSI